MKDWPTLAQDSRPWMSIWVMQAWSSTVLAQMILSVSHFYFVIMWLWALIIYTTDPAHGLRLNPPVRIRHWPDPDPDLDFNPAPEDEDEPINGPDRDPEYAERDEPLGFDPVDEPQFADQEVRRLLELNLGDLADELWLDMCKSSSLLSAVYLLPAHN
jgi:hypothetical protein